jgi:ribosomal protein S18 acetylase RimI-like enzyme
VIRRATTADAETLHALYREFAAECPPPPYVPFDLDKELREIDEILATGDAFVAERDGDAVAFALGRVDGPRLGSLTDLYVRPDARRGGLGRSLIDAVVDAMAARGIDHLRLDVDVSNLSARRLYERTGFREAKLELIRPIGQRSSGPSFGYVYVQTDDVGRVERAVREFLPRLGRSPRTEVSAQPNGWVRVDDELCSSDPKLLRRLARELSDRLGAVLLSLGVEDGAVVRYILFDRGRVADEYASVPEYHGPLPPGDVVALGANSTIAQRLTGADPARVRAVARTAASPEQLPPAPELARELAGVLGVDL